MEKEKMLELAESGDVKAMEEVANAYYRGKNGFEEDRVKAAQWFQKLLEIDPENLIGLNGMGNTNYNGYGVPVDTEKGAAFYLKAAELGYSKSQFNLASHYSDEGDPRCVGWYEKAFENGEYDAAGKLGEIFAEGKIVPQDYAKAIEWYKAGADKGDDASELRLACEYLSGENTPKDEALALKWMVAAAEAGNSAAMNNLAIMYSTGDCVEVDYDIGLEWAIKGCKAGDASQLTRYAAFFEDGDGFLPHNPQKALELFLIGAEAGDKACMRHMSLKYFKGEGVEQDEKKALHWAEEAAKKADPVALDLILILGRKIYGEDAPKRYFEVVKAGADDGYYECMVRVFECYRDGAGVEKNHELALKYLKEASEEGYSKALFHMGAAYMSGELVGQANYEKGLECYHKIIAKGNKDNVTAAALRNLGYAYKEATGVEQDLEQAIEYFEASAELGNTDALIRAGLAHDDDGWATLDYAKAAHFYQKLADADDPTGMWLLAVAYDNGKGLDADKQKAFEFYQKAAEKDFAPALAALGFVYYNGEVVPKDLKKAVECWEKAASLGHEKSGELLQKVYASEEFSGVIDHEKVANQLRARADAGDADAMYQISEQLSEAGKYDEAKEWERKAAEGGNADAQFGVGFSAYLLERYDEAVPWLEKAVAQGHAGAMTAMADILSDGNSAVGTNEQKAFEYYTEAARLGNIRAMYLLGRCYYYGRGVAIDYTEAFNWFNKAMQCGCNEMWFELGNCYRYGNGVQQDLAKAVELYNTGVEKQNCNFCRLRLGMMAADNELPYYNPSVASQYLETLSNNDDFKSDATYALGMMYSRMGDIVQSIKWLEKSAEAGNATAQYNLGVVYFNGELGSRDLDRAEYYFSLAARNGYPGADKDAADCRQLKAAMQRQAQAQNRQTSTQPTSQPSSSGGGGCYVATAVYGSYDCPEVWTLRRFRDYTLAESWYGRAFIKVYYAISPSLVAWFGETSWFKHMWRGKLDRMVRRLQEEGFESTPYDDPQY